jgi:hypothetical protein
VSYFTLHCGKLVPCSKCHGNRISEIARLRRKWVFFTVRFVTVTSVTHKPSLAPASLPECFLIGRCWWRVKLRRSSVAVATSREGHRKPRSGRANRHQRWGRELVRGDRQ